MNRLIDCSAAVCLALGLTANTALGARKTSWDVTVTYEGPGTDMMGHGTVNSGQDLYFLWQLGKGRNSVQVLGKDAQVDVRKLLPSSESEGAGERPDHVVLILVRPGEGDDGKTSATVGVTRWGLVGQPPPWDYRLTGDVSDYELEDGERVPLLVGTGREGEDLYLELTVTPRSDGPRHDRSDAVTEFPVEFTYELWDQEHRTEGPVARQVRTVLVETSDSEHSVARFEVPVHAPGYDSSEIHLQVHLSDLDVFKRGQNPRLQSKGVFNVDRSLVLDIVPSGKPGVIQASRIVSSEYAHAVTLRQEHRVRVRLPRQESSYLSPDLTEVVIIRPLEVR